MHLHLQQGDGGSDDEPLWRGADFLAEKHDEASAGPQNPCKRRSDARKGRQRLGAGPGCGDEIA